MRSEKYPAIFYLCCCLCLRLFSADDDFLIEQTIDWQAKFLFLDLTKHPDLQQTSGPDIRFHIEQELENRFPVLAFNAILSIPVDSLYTIQDYLQDNPDYFSRLNASLKTRKKEYSYFSPDKQKFHFRFSCPLYGETGLISCFINHTTANPIPAVPGFTASREYTGIVVYARGNYPFYGGKQQGKLQPVFFPDFYDEQLNLFFNESKCDPGFLKQWGMVAYAGQLDETRYAARIGNSPLRTSLVGIFGKQHTDLILPGASVRKILSLPANRKLLSEGRILIICNVE